MIGWDSLMARFVAESNKIEGIVRVPTDAELAEHQQFIRLDEVTVEDLERFVSVVASGHVIRDREGLDVRVGRHVAPPGGPDTVFRLEEILSELREQHPFKIHCRYETLHPFTDGNGRSGRALWLWGMWHAQGDDRGFMQRGFLHTWYYQSLEFSQWRVAGNPG